MFTFLWHTDLILLDQTTISFCAAHQPNQYSLNRFHFLSLEPMLLSAASDRDTWIIVNPLSASPHKMVEHTQPILRLLPTRCFSVLDYFAGLSLKGLKTKVNIWNCKKQFLFTSQNKKREHASTIKLESNQEKTLNRLC